MQPVAALPGVRELHIGHAIVSRAVFTGLREAVRQMKALMREAAAERDACNDGGVAAARSGRARHRRARARRRPIASACCIRSSAASSCSRATTPIRRSLRALTAQIRALRTPALLISVDHEGGRVQRFREGFTAIPPMRTLGELWDRDVGGGRGARRGAWA